MTVWVVVYDHRHGTDISVHSTEEKAIDAALELARNRADEDWQDDVKASALRSMSGGDALRFFHDVESDQFYYNESLEIFESEVR